MGSNANVARQIQEKQTELSEAKWTAATRKAYYKERPWAFAGPDMSFPIRDLSDVGDAWGLAGHADDPDAVRAKIISIAKRLGLTKGLPATAADFGKKEGKEAAPASSAEFSPPPTNRSARIATITSCFLEDYAISLNGRQYPPEAVDRLIQSAQVQLSDPNSLPMTCYLSHEDADRDKTQDLVGRVTNVWREGSRAYASIDIPPTTSGREVVTLINGNYIRSQSLRASGAEMMVSKDATFPLVGGQNLKLEGIDFTTSPGLPSVARITNLALAESHRLDELIEVFNAHKSNFGLLLEEQKIPVQEEGNSMEDPKESGMYQSGDSPHMDGSTADADGWAARNLPVPEVCSPDEMSGASLPSGLSGGSEDEESANPAMREGMRQMHDHVARILDAHLAPMHGGASEATQSLEARRKSLAMHEATRLVDAHDTAARHLGMACEGIYDGMINKMLAPDSAPGNDGMQDGDDDDTESQKHKPQVKETVRPMTAEEAARLLQAQGYAIKPPKTREQVLREQLEARLAEERRQLKEQLEAQTAAQSQQLEEMKEMLRASQVQTQELAKSVPQRRSLVEGAQAKPSPQALQRKPSYIQEQIRAQDPLELIDRSRPLPEPIAQNLERSIAEYSKILLGIMFDAYGWPVG